MKAPLSRTFFDLLGEMADARPDVVFAIAEDRTTTFADLHRAASRIASALAQRGIGRGARIGLLAPNCIEWLEVAFGCTALGATVVPFSTWAKPAELDYLLQDSRVEIVFTVASFGRQDFLAAFSDLLGEGSPAPQTSFPHLREIVVLDDGAHGWTRYADVLASGDGFAPIPPGEGARAVDDVFVLYTSGSSARPKAVRVVHSAAIENGFNIGERQKLTTQDRVLVSPPLFWIYACGNALTATLTHGATLVLQSQFDADRALDLIEKHRCTSIYTLPTMTAALVRSERFAPERTASLRTGLTIGSASDVELAATGLGATEICNIYGATEVYGNCCVTPCDWPLDHRMACQGPPLPGVSIRIVDQETRAPLPAGEVGEAEISGYRTPGYAGASAVHDEQAFTEDGYFRSGDLAFLDESGFFHFVSRGSEIIKRAGINVSPAEIEDRLQRLDGISQVGVVGSPDREKGEIIVAFIVPKADARLDEDEIRAYCRSHLSSYKIPDRIEIRSSLPVTETGKLSRRQLKDIASSDGNRADQQ